ncbi:MAG: hypothetical protein ACTTH5_02715 [Wolinella sp.]
MNFGIRNLVLVALFMSGAMAAESGAFIGASLGFMSSKNNALLSAGPKDNPSDGVEISLNFADSTFERAFKAGYHISSLHRYYIEYATSGAVKKKLQEEEITIEYKTSKFLLGYDFTPEIIGTWRGVAGVYVGILQRDTTFKAEGTLESLKSKGSLVGLKLGAIYEVMKNGDIELGMKFESANIKKHVMKDDEDILIELTKQKQNNVGLYAGYVYRF